MATAISVPHIMRTRCKTCVHSYDPRELLGGLCSYCLAKRIDALNEFGSIFDNPELRYRMGQAGRAKAVP